MQRENVWKPIRITAAALGGLLLLVAVFGDRIGLGGTGGFGMSQGLALLLGCGLVTIAGVGNRFPVFYRGTALILLNALVLFSLLELGVGLILRVTSPTGARPAAPARAAYYATQSWGEEYWREFGRAYKYKYAPYQMWRVAPFDGELINVGQDGLRSTPGAACTEGASTVVVFVGSTVWGLGVPDWGTVPAYLQAGLGRALQGAVCVRNYGQLGANSTQDLIALLRDWQVGRIPDVVVFLSGVNDVIPQFANGEAGVHFEPGQIGARVEAHLNQVPGEAVQSNSGWVTHLNIYRLAIKLVSKGLPTKPIEFRTSGHVSDSLAAAIVQVYLGNYRIVEGLAREYGFTAEFFWQPNLLVGRKPLTTEEEGFKAGLQVAPLVEGVYRRLAAVDPAGHRSLHNLMDLFAAERSAVYIDWHHLAPEGNRLVAEAMMGVVVAAAQTGRRAVFDR